MIGTSRTASGDRVDAGAALIVGGGIAGLFCALKLAPLPVTLLTRNVIGTMASSALAQGGIAAALGPGDSPALHADDTLAAAAGIAEAEAVARLTGEAPDRVADMIAFGTAFDSDESGLLLGREAAHSASRIVHAGGDRSGAAIMATLIRAVRDTPSIRVVESCEALALALQDGRVVGLHARAGDTPMVFTAPAVVLATGGLGQLYRVTTNPAGLCGDGIALAARAGAVLADLEFVQFHPTALAVGGDPAPLATEALRGAGATLIDAAGQRFMPQVHEWAELAPRDVVARAIWRQVRNGRGAFLDARDAVGAAFPTRFPAVYGYCTAAGIDPLRDPIPVAPAAHYHMGGVATDLAGRTSVAGLWACGEVASTGVHGANRLASNSLLEGMVFGTRVAADIAGQAPGRPPDTTSIEPAPSAGRWDAAVAPLRAKLRQVMSERVGVVRDGARLVSALAEIAGIERAGAPLSAGFANAVLTAKLVTIAALARRESRGAHFREDFPATAPIARRAFLTLEQAEALMLEAAADIRPALAEA
jgi:L-aspartate oxidase